MQKAGNKKIEDLGKLLHKNISQNQKNVWKAKVPSEGQELTAIPSSSGLTLKEKEKIPTALNDQSPDQNGQRETPEDCTESLDEIPEKEGTLNATLIFLKPALNENLDDVALESGSDNDVSTKEGDGNLLEVQDGNEFDNPLEANIRSYSQDDMIVNPTKSVQLLRGANSDGEHEQKKKGRPRGSTKTTNPPASEIRRSTRLQGDTNPKKNLNE
ncbi:OLC1v1036121C1 [Oldenlandia corymbosa var. corymbosa]|uniref:OLC1v1036121C1 n=1 Tax=Oldenlandia corymbosa var. corymbosa TaxID=529605 RepID=A0AAV1CUN7_OLDCO|nr:OLC1v1036121C1 [Oldenlandia corymbosa var. corymbosa]